MTRLLVALSGPAELGVALAGGAALVALPAGDLAALREVVEMAQGGSVEVLAAWSGLGGAAAAGAPDAALLAGLAQAGVAWLALADAGEGPWPGEAGQEGRAEAGREGGGSGRDEAGGAAGSVAAVLASIRDGAGAGRPSVVAGFTLDRPPSAARLAQLAGRGLAAALLDLDDAGAGMRRPLDLPAIAAFVASCRACGLQAWLAGWLEPPDMPRLLVLHPDVLWFGAFPCAGAGAGTPFAAAAGARFGDAARRVARGGLRAAPGALRPGALAAIRALMPQAGAAPAPGAAAGSDSVFVRDLVLAVQVGAYAHERGAAQRVRFAVQAWVARPVGPGRGAGRGMAEVFSYDLITDGIRRLTTGRHVALLETLAEEIAALLLAQPAVLRVIVRLEKLDTGSGVVGCEIERARGGA